MRTTSVLALALLGAAHAACGSGNATQQPTPTCDAGGCTPLTPADEAFLDKYCTTIEACCVANAQRSAPDVAGCKAQLGHMGFSHDSAVQSACLAEVQGRAGTATCVPSAGDLSGPCVRLFYEPGGTKAVGELCTERAQCAGAPGKITLCTGNCLQIASGKAGDGPCLGIASEKGVVNAAPLTQPGTGGQQIFSGYYCDRGAGFYCAYATDPAQQTCQALGAAGASCAGLAMAMSCAAGACADDGTCQAIVSAGQPCSNQVSAVCDSASYCGAQNICVARAPAGTACAGDSECLTDSCTTDKHCAAIGFIDLFGFCGRNAF